MDEIFARALADAVARYLAAAEQAADLAPMGRLVAAWRSLLRLHRPTVHRGCPGCVHRRGEMCNVWRVAIGHFLASSDPEGPGRSADER